MRSAPRWARYGASSASDQGNNARLLSDGILAAEKVEAPAAVVAETAVGRVRIRRELAVQPAPWTASEQRAFARAGLTQRDRARHLHAALPPGLNVAIPEDGPRRCIRRGIGRPSTERTVRPGSRRRHRGHDTTLVPAVQPSGVLCALTCARSSECGSPPRIDDSDDLQLDARGELVQSTAPIARYSAIGSAAAPGGGILLSDPNQSCRRWNSSPPGFPGSLLGPPM